MFKKDVVKGTGVCWDSLNVFINQSQESLWLWYKLVLLILHISSGVQNQCLDHGTVDVGRLHQWVLFLYYRSYLTTLQPVDGSVVHPSATLKATVDIMPC